MRAEKTRGPKMNAFLAIVRGCQDIMGMLVLGGVFERHPDLSIVCVEADAGWVPHFMYRMDHAYKRHRYWLPAGQELSQLPSEYFANNIYVTFQDDWTAFQLADDMNWQRLLWANDFPHTDSTWPWSQEMLAEHTKELTDEQKRAILCGQRPPSSTASTSPRSCERRLHREADQVVRDATPRSRHGSRATTTGLTASG